jgi:UDP-N-acetylglucosamine 4,6-dehydratase
MFKNKTLLISGGTGSFGNAIINRFLDSDIKEIRIFSRDEKKQDDLRKKYNNPKLKFYIGDVRDFDSISNAIVGVDFVFHAAALKQVPSCEFFPMEAFKTNVLGTENLISAAISHKVKRIICLSTDKAVYPINAMGFSKAMMEKVAISKSRLSSDTVISITRYGNVMASRGSVIPLFFEKVLSGEPISITDPSMTRFMMTLDDAVDLVMYAFEHGRNGDIFVQKAPAATIETLVEAILKIMSKPNYSVEIIGTRHGEKLYESLLSREEASIAEDLGRYYRISPDLRDLNYSGFIDKGQKINQNSQDYNSNNTERLDLDGMVNLLQKLNFIKQFNRGEKPVLDY